MLHSSSEASHVGEDSDGDCSAKGHGAVKRCIDLGVGGDLWLLTLRKLACRKPFSLNDAS